MYYKLPVKERMNLMKSYKKANPDMSYHDMVKDYNDSYEKFKDGGIKKEVPAYQSKDLKDYIYRKQMYNDSLNLSKNSLYELRELNKSDMTYNKFKDIQNHSQTSRAKEAYDNLTKTNGVKPNPSTKVGKEFTNTVFKQEFGSVNIYQPPKQSILPPKGEVKNELTKVNTFVKNQNREPIITHDKNDPRLRAYNDSLSLYNKGKTYLDKPYSNDLYDYTQDLIRFGKSKKITPIESKKGISELMIPQYKKPVQPYIYKKPEEKEQSRTDVYTDKVLFNKAYKAEKDSMNEFTKYQDNIKGWVPVNTVKNENKVKDFVKNGQDLKDAYYNKAENAITYFPAKPKKPVVHNVYEPPPPKEEPVKDSIPYKPKPKSIKSDTTRQWNFNGPNPVMEYYDKSGKLIKKEYYTGVNGKKIKPLTK